MLKDHFIMINNTAEKKNRKERRFYHILSAVCLFFQLTKLIKAFIIVILTLTQCACLLCGISENAMMLVSVL